MIEEYATWVVNSKPGIEICGILYLAGERKGFIPSGWLISRP